MRKFVSCLVSLVLLASVSACGSAYAGVPACEFEDGSGQAGVCKWDAGRMGNGQGSGVFVYRDGVLIAKVGV